MIPEKKMPPTQLAPNTKEAIQNMPVDDNRVQLGNGQWVDSRFQTPYAFGVDVPKLVSELEKSISGEVRFDDGSRALYSTDASNYRQIPIGVVLPKTEADILMALQICRKYGAPVLSRGGGTSLAGQTCNVAVVMDMSKYYNQVLNIDADKKLVTVQPGIVLDEMRKATISAVNQTFGPDPATHSRCTLGGMLGNNSCGVHSIAAEFAGYGGRTSDNTEALSIATYDGIKMTVGKTSDEEYERIQQEGGRKAEIYKKLREFRDKYADLIREHFPNIPRRVSGYNLPALLPENGFDVAQALVGSEGTLVTILEATLKLYPEFNGKSLLVLGYPSLPETGYAVPEILKHKPIGLEGIDDYLIDFMRRKGLDIKNIPLLPPGSAWLLVEFGGNSKEESDGKAKGLMEALQQQKNPPSMSLFDDPAQEAMLWKIREDGLGATAWVPGEPNGGPGWEDSAVAVDKVGDYLKDLRALFTKYDYHPSIYGHFGQGCIHCRVGFDFQTADGIRKYKKFTVEASHLVVKYGGSLSGEHGDGQARGDLLEIMFGKEMVQAFREFKEIWDPEWKMNPGKIVETYGQTNDLRLGVDYNPPQLKTHFQFPAEGYSWSGVALRCVGVGECRRHEGGTMCPSYMATREEKHSTRGRSRLLFEALQGDVIKGGWKSEAVKDALDLCLACKGCKGDCPVNVDMATYKAEFLSHYYEGKRRPLHAYLFGWIHWWANLASLEPGLVNFLTHAPVLSTLTKKIFGIAPQRSMPWFADITFRKWFQGRKKYRAWKSRKQRIAATGKNKVILWTDTFNNNFLPETLVAGVHVLEAAGFEVVIPQKNLCCGRPLYDFGMLHTAKKLLEDIMGHLKEEIEQGVPIVGLEPSCVAVFRDELLNFFPHRQDALRLSRQVYTLAEFLREKAPDFKVPELPFKAIVHGHCHHRAIMKMDADKKVLDGTGLDYKVLSDTCCGMAGYFGYEQGDHYDVSIKCGEMELLPMVRKADKDTLIMTDGFSCREQIAQETDRSALHLAEVLHLGLKGGNPGAYPGKKYQQSLRLKNPDKMRDTLVVLAVVGLGFWAYKSLKTRNRHAV